MGRLDLASTEDASTEDTSLWNRPLCDTSERRAKGDNKMRHLLQGGSARIPEFHAPE